MDRKELWRTIGWHTLLVATVFTFAVFFTSIALAQPTVPEINPLTAIGELIMNWGGMSDLAKGVLFVNIMVQVIKQAVDFQYKRTLVVVFSVIYGIAQMVMGGESAMGATVAVLVSGGGAMALYEVLKPLLKKIKFLKIG